MENNLKNRIKFIRNYLGLTRRSFADKLEISEATIRRWENGSAKRLYPATVEQLLKGLLKLDVICSSEWIIKGTGVNPKKIIDESRKFYEVINLPGSNYNLPNHIDFDIIANKFPRFYGYADTNEIFLWMNKNWQPSHRLNKSYDEIVGNSFKELVGDKLYETCKPYLNKALSGHEVTFEADWEYEPGKFKYYNTSYVPNIKDDNVIGIYVFADINFDNDSDEIASEQNLNEILPKLPLTNTSYIAENYIYSLKGTEDLLKQYNINYDMSHILKIAYHLYCYWQTYGFFDQAYADSIIKIALKSKYLFVKDTE